MEEKPETPVLLALDEVATLTAPSIAHILRHNKYKYEAQLMEELIRAYNDYKAKSHGT